METVANRPSAFQPRGSASQTSVPTSGALRLRKEPKTIEDNDASGRGRSDDNTPPGFSEERKTHDALLALERCVDAYLEVNRLKQHFGKNIVENDAACVESCFRRAAVEKVYADLQREECIERLSSPSTRKETLPISEESLQEINHFILDAQSTDDGKRPSDEGSEPTLLERVFAHSTHPRLRAEKVSDWRKVLDDGEDLQVFLRTYADNREMISFRLEGKVDAPLLNILSVFNEVDLFAEWVPYYKTPFRLGLHKVDCTSLGRVDKLVQFHVHFPWPLANRDALIEVFAVDDLERNGNVVVKMITPDVAHASPRDRGVPPAPEKGVCRIIVDGSLVIQPLGRDASKLSLLWHENCGMHVPAKMVEFVVKMFCRTAFERCRSICKAAGTSETYINRRKANPSLYEFIAERLEQLGLLGEQVGAHFCMPWMGRLYTRAGRSAEADFSTPGTTSLHSFSRRRAPRGRTF